MMRLFTFLIFFVGALLSTTSAWGQVKNYVVVQDILIEGRKKTRFSTITREMNFGSGDTLWLDDMAQQLERNRQLLMNTGLFIWVEINVKNWEIEEGVTDISIRLQEAWYIFPVPIFELADRNFNVWWETYNRSLKRVDYGGRFYHTNFTGRGDQIKLVLQQGFTHKYEINYNLPFVNKAQTLGMSSDLLYSSNRDVRIATANSRDSFLRDESQRLFRRVRAGLGFQYRPELLETHNLDIKYIQRTIADTVAQRNPDFFLNERLKQRYFEMRYRLALDYRDFRPYPLSGNYYSVELVKEGFGVFKDRNALIINSKYAQYMPLSAKFSMEVILEGETNLVRKRQPYYNNRALGFGTDFIRGYEKYVVDGMDYAYAKTSLRFELFDNMLDFGNYVPIQAFRKMPLKVYAKLNSDWGYVNEPFYQDTNTLSNQLLWGGGFGIDLVLYADKVVQLEYSFNRLGESGFFIHTELGF